MASKPPYDFLNLPPLSVQLDVNAIDEFLNSHGVKLVHYRAIKCPIGITEKNDDMNQTHEDHQGCSNGYIYTKGGEITCFFLGNSNQPEFTDMGKLASGMVQTTFPRYYDDTQDEVDICVFDRFYLCQDTLTVSYWQTVQYNPSGIDRLHFPAKKVIDLIDSLGNTYKQDVDFRVRDGKIFWTGRSPGVDPETQLGRIYSIRYRYIPYWYLSRFSHEIRVSRSMDMDGNVIIVPLPQSGILTREFVFENQRADPRIPLSLRMEPQEDDDGNLF